MAYRGRRQLGETLQLHVWCRDATGTPRVPDDPPQLWVYDAAGTKVLGKEVPVLDRYVLDGLFHFWLYLDSKFQAGQYRAVYRYTANGLAVVESDNFEVVLGGNADGAVISMYYLDRPQAKYVVQQLDSGRLAAGRNPIF